MAVENSNLASDLKKARKNTSVYVFSKRLIDFIVVVLELKEK